MSYTHFVHPGKDMDGGGGAARWCSLLDCSDRITWHFELCELLTLGWGVISLDFDILGLVANLLPLNGFGRECRTSAAKWHYYLIKHCA